MIDALGYLSVALIVGGKLLLLISAFADVDLVPLGIFIAALGVAILIPVVFEQARLHGTAAPIVIPR